MVLILDGNSEVVTHVYKEIGNLICLRRVLRSVAVTNLKKNGSPAQYA